jgi:nucleoid-associated protein YgaU
MTRSRLIGVIVLLAAMGGTLLWLSDARWLGAIVSVSDNAAETTVATTSPDTSEPSSSEVVSSEVSTSDEAARPAPDAPAFDIVRVEDSGSVVIAGTAPPEWRVRVSAQDRVIGEVKTGFDGTWVLLPEAPLPPGDHSLSVTALSPDGARTVNAPERVAVSVAQDSAPAVVALSRDNQPTRILQSGMVETPRKPGNAPDADSLAVAITTVDYELRDPTGQLHLSGQAEAGARIALYLDDRFIGSTRADTSGAWRFTLTDILDSDTHTIRADHVHMADGEVRARAEVAFQPEGVAVAASEPGETRTALAGEVRSGGASARQARATQATTPDIGGGPAALSERAQAPGETSPTAVVVRQGDTLWHIAERHYGSGVRYTKIFRTNRDQIRSPHRIYPGQRFDLPQQSN